MEKYVESQIVVFQSDGIEDIKAFHAKDTMWLTLDQMGVLFECEPSLIPKHIEDFLKEEKLDEDRLVLPWEVDSKCTRSSIVARCISLSCDKHGLWFRLCDEFVLISGVQSCCLEPGE